MRLGEQAVEQCTYDSLTIWPQRAYKWRANILTALDKKFASRNRRRHYLKSTSSISYNNLLAQMFAMKLSMSNLNFTGQLPTRVAWGYWEVPHLIGTVLKCSTFLLLWVYFVSLQDNCLQSIFRADSSLATSMYFFQISCHCT